MAIEYCPRGDLFNFIKRNGALPPELANSLFLEILDAVEYLHEKGSVAHLDLKLENILLSDDF